MPGPHSAAAHPVHHGLSKSAATDRVEDPVCGMMIDPATSQHQADREGKTYYFCSNECRAEFIKHPAKYATR